MWSLSFPLRLDPPAWRRLPDGRLERLRWLQREHLGLRFELLDAEGKPILASARDDSGVNGGQGLRLTRLVGVRHGLLLKSCPRCGEAKPVEDFGLRRAEGLLRDQSHCTACRGS